MNEKKTLNVIGKAGYIFVCCQENSWVDEPTMRRYLTEIWFQEGIFKTKKIHY